MTAILRKEDPDRLIDQASGWFDQGGGDFCSLHNYFFKLKIHPERRGHQFFRNLEDTVTGSKDIVPVENFMDMGSAGVKKH